MSEAAMDRRYGWGGIVYDHLVRFLREPVQRWVRSLQRLDGGEMSVQILKFDRVCEGCATFATVGFGKGLPSPHEYTELILVADWGEEHIPRILSEACLYLMDEQIVPFVGMCMGTVADSAPEFVELTGKGALYFTSPFPFPEEFVTMCDGGRHGQFLMVTFISYSERAYLRANGADALETLLSEAKVDVFDVRREPAV